MSARSPIEWTDATWNPVRGCTRVSEGCVNCYAEIMAARFSKSGQWGHGFATMKGGDHRWTGKVALIESQLALPLKWKTPRRIFVNSTSDLFHESLPDEAIDRIFGVMAIAQQHTFQILTKRPERMRAFMANVEREAIWMTEVAGVMDALELKDCQVPILTRREPWLPLPNVWLGVSVEDQERADGRIPALLETPAAVRFISVEPLLGPIDLTDVANNGDAYYDALRGHSADESIDGTAAPALDWVIAGGESGPNARPMHPEWARALRDQCTAAGVPFFFKQWGEHKPRFVFGDGGGDSGFGDCEEFEGHDRVGKKNAGRMLDGREHNDFPTVRTP